MATEVEPIAGTEIPLPYVTLGDGIIASDWALKHLNAALGKAQDEFAPAVKDVLNSYSNYKYVPLDNIISCSRSALSKNHLTVMQFPFADLERKTITLTTRMVHWDSGEWVQSVLELPAELALGKDGALKFNQQTIGGGVTYARKIAYKPIVGVADSDDDIDATESQPSMDSRPKKTTPAQALATAPKQQPATQPQQTQQSPPPKQEDRGIFKLMPDGVLTCFIKGITAKETKEKKPYLVVTVNGYLKAAKDEQGGNVNHGFCYDTGLFDALKLGVTKECQLKLDLSGKFVKITEVFYVDGQEFVEGKPVVLPTDDEPVPEP